MQTSSKFSALAAFSLLLASAFAAPPQQLAERELTDFLFARSLPVSPDGTCGGSTGYGCASGFCCSTAGYCGQGEQYCKSSGAPIGTGVSSSSPPLSTGTGYPSVPSSTPSGTGAAPGPTSTGSSGGGKGLGNTYKLYSGDGSAAAGWPQPSEWVDFDTMWSTNEPTMTKSCGNLQSGLQDDSSTEIADIKSAIMSVSQSSGVDPRFILAIVMQESNGCVRVKSTNYGVNNPGLMQSHDGSGSCNPSTAGTAAVSPCPSSEITQMIKDGTLGTSSGAGIQKCMQQAPGTGLAQKFYQGATIYNAGSLPSDGNLDDSTATKCYAPDVANRLTGWLDDQATSPCNLGVGK